MHELSLCRSIAAITDRHRQGRRVTRVNLRIGAFRQAVPRTLVSCWTLVTEGTAMAGSRLEIELVPLVIECRSCGARTQLDEVRLRCPACTRTDVAIVQGQEFAVASLDLIDD